MQTNTKALRRGLLITTISFVIWGLSPLYWKLLAEVDLVTLVAHRMLWSFVFAVVVARFIRGSELKELMHNRRALLILAAASICVAATWWLFIYAVVSGQTLQASLGFYINPLMVIAAGVFFFREKLTTLQKIATALAAIGVTYFTVDYGTFPWLAVGMAAVFALYGALKKKGGYSPVPALAVETSILAPLAIVLVVATFFMPESNFIAESTTAEGWITWLLLMGGGLITVVPLLCFSIGVNALPISWVGFLQYIEPTLTLLIGVFAFGEAFTFAHAFCFGCIWLGLALISIEFARDAKKTNNEALSGES